MGARAFRATPSGLKRVVRFRRITPGTLDPVTDASTGDSTIEAVGSFVVAPARPGSLSGGGEDALEAWRSGEQVRAAGHILLGLVTTPGFLPAPGDVATWGTETGRVIAAGAHYGLLRVAVER